MFGERLHVADGVEIACADSAKSRSAGHSVLPKIQQGRRHPNTALAGLDLCIRSRMVRNRRRGMATSAIRYATSRIVQPTLGPLLAISLGSEANLHHSASWRVSEDTGGIGEDRLDVGDPLASLTAAGRGWHWLSLRPSRRHPRGRALSKVVKADRLPRCARDQPESQARGSFFCPRQIAN